MDGIELRVFIFWFFFANAFKFLWAANVALLLSCFCYAFWSYCAAGAAVSFPSNDSLRIAVGFLTYV